MEKGSWSACLSYALPTIKITWCRRADKSNISETNICGDRFVFFEWDCAFALLVTEESWQIIVSWLCICITSHERKPPNRHGSTMHMRCQSQKKTTKSSWVNCAYVLPVTKESWQIIMDQLRICVASYKRKLTNYHGSTAHMRCQSQRKSEVDCAYALPVTKENHQIGVGRLRICVASHRRKLTNCHGSTVIIVGQLCSSVASF